jgi:AraC-like DNA-binding protein
MILLNSSQQLILFISAAGVIQAIILAGLLFFHTKSDRTVTPFLSGHILTVSIFMLMPVVQYFISWQSIIFLIPFQFLIGPFLYLYVCSFKQTITWRKAWPHFLLSLVIAAADILFYFTWVKNFPASAEVPDEVLLDPRSSVQAIIRNLQMLLYFFLTRRELNRYQKSIHQLYSETSRINLGWMRWLLNGFLLLNITVIILAFLVFKYPEKFGLFILINTAVIAPYIYFIAVRGIGQPALWQIMPEKTKKEVEKEINEAEIIETRKTGQEEPLLKMQANPDPKATGIANKIVALLEKEKIYQEPELTIKNMADKIQVPYYQVSQAINDVLNKNFYDLVNGYRVEEAKRLLLHPGNRNYTILSVGFEAGFNSKTTFNTVFKKFTGLTPTEYRDKQK